MNANALRGAVLLMALVLILMPVAVSSFVAGPVLALALLAWLPYLAKLVRPRSRWRDLLGSELGAVTVTYFGRSGVPGGVVLLNNTTTGPTNIQASQLPMLKVQVTFSADTDVQALVTHNWGLDKSGPTYFDPIVFLMGGTNLGANSSLAPNFSMDWSNTNVLKINKFNFVGTNGTYIFCLQNSGAMLASANPWL